MKPRAKSYNTRWAMSYGTSCKLINCEMRAKIRYIVPVRTVRNLDRSMILRCWPTPYIHGIQLSRLIMDGTCRLQDFVNLTIKFVSFVKALKPALCLPRDRDYLKLIKDFFGIIASGTDRLRPVWTLLHLAGHNWWSNLHYSFYLFIYHITFKFVM